MLISGLHGLLQLRRQTPVVLRKCLPRSTGTSAMLDQASSTPVEAAVLATPKPIEGGSAANLSALQATRLPLQRCCRGCTLAELVVSIGVLVLLVFLATQLLN